jgi:hypothetical protein
VHFKRNWLEMGSKPKKKKTTLFKLVLNFLPFLKPFLDKNFEKEQGTFSRSKQNFF